jgi:hypothetical protein
MEDQHKPFKFTVTGNYQNVKDPILSAKNGRQTNSYSNNIDNPVDTVWITNPKTNEPYIMSVPYCDYDVAMDNARLSLTVECTVTTKELTQKKYSTMAVIDCILLVPVSEDNEE